MASHNTRSATKVEEAGDELRKGKTKENIENKAHDEEKGHIQKMGDKRKKNPVPETSNKSLKVEASDQATKSHDQEGKVESASPEQVLAFLLSNRSLEICRPEDETKDLSQRGKGIVTYAQLLSPFEELLCAVILSRPISHRLGLRAIRTILNPPYEFKDADSIKAAGAENIHQALDDARTQHKGKTTEEIELIAEAVADNNWGNDLEKIRKQAKNAVDRERENLRASVKGLGQTGLDIFYRRIQWLWDEAFPFVDERTQKSLEKLGLPNKPDELVHLIENNWQSVEFEEENHEEGPDDDMKKRRAFVILLERAVGADLEKKSEDVLVAAAKM